MACRQSRTVSVSLVVSLILLVVAACDNGLKRIVPPSMNSSAAASQAMEMYDQNQDSKISGDEFQKCVALKAIAKDGAVTPDMIADLVAKWTKGPVGRVGVGVQVLHNGKPLRGVTVKLTPEKFLGPNIKAAEATTDNFGGAAISLPTRDPGEPKGVPLGFYRVEIAKDGESIPAKYNAETMLSIAVLGEQTGGVTFNLIY